jgi:lipopolysaccharide/colanic/teichoic acid biosynthesis glycosyltransferase
LSLPDTVVAALAPWLALYLRNGQFLVFADVAATAIYWGLSFAFALAGFAAFRVRGAIPRYFSVGDLADLGMAVLAAEMSTCIALFSLTRLEGIPRSLPAIHALILGAGLIAVRAVMRFIDRDGAVAGEPTVSAPGHPPGHIILIGISDLSVLFMKFLGTAYGGKRRVIALLDENARWFGRAIDGVRVFGPPSHLEALVAEFATHGVRTDCVVIGTARAELPGAALSSIEDVCREHAICLEFVPEFLSAGFGGRRIAVSADPRAAPQTVPIRHAAPARIVPSGYFRCRRAIDLAVASILLILLSPLWLAAALIALADVGTPILFWQQRAGHRGRAIHLYKIRTLRASFGRDGRRVPEAERTAWGGRLLRQTRLDEIPQLLNVLVGDMALIGPRPLLPHDQPENPANRLAVRPGITGWAQVNGGVLLSPAEKNELDAWYIANASAWLDLRIVALTLRSLVNGDRRSETALARARGMAWIATSTRFARAAESGPAKERGQSAVGSL